MELAVDAGELHAEIGQLRRIIEMLRLRPFTGRLETALYSTPIETLKSESVVDEIKAQHAYWIGSNGADEPEMAEAILAALIDGGDYGAFTVETMGAAKLVTGPVSVLVLPGEVEEAALMELLEEHAGRASEG